ncbi:hypothetical protein L195_g046040 [Trifolium pratense]|uniref:Uncharacterized protein n=1 Tax=Trifolium pratense TaxID=57577 RepID=A0A2K3LHW5_TRIPR|nr:hypothetical protein L195_g034105 [Trifolium pratense]PNX85425.1 hypothetical protein L195_g041494 [Trifolium pratense]PNX89917.1 hypothetical protein L195_g046040 [Trifolium pratense]
MAMIEKRFGDEKSTLLDEFERLSFEAHAAQLNKAMLRRSLSEPRLQRSPSRLISMAPIPLMNKVMQGPHHGNIHGLGFHRVLKKLIKPIFGRKRVRGGRKHVTSDPKDIMLCKEFSRSLRL